MARPSLVLFAGGVIAIALVIAIATGIILAGRSSSTSGETSAAGTPLIGGDFNLVNQDGQPVDQTMLNSKWSLVFFGFTFCPEFCPTTLAELAVVQQRLGKDADRFQIIFVSIDPERDTPQALKDYLSSDGFPKGTIGLSGTAEQTAQAAKAYRAYYAKVGSGDSYTMDHSLTVYLMGPDGKFRTALTYGLGPDKSVQLIQDALAKG